jgi:hypothetical protein
MTNKPAAAPTFDRYGTCELLRQGQDDDFQWLGVVRQKDGRHYALSIEDGNSDASYSDLTPQGLRELGQALIDLAKGIEDELQPAKEDLP